MPTSERLAKNTLYLTLASIGQKAVAFVYFAAIARFMGADNTGAYFIALAITLVVAAVAELGISAVVIREVAKKKSKAVLWSRTMIGVKLWTIPVAVVIVLLAPVLFGYRPEVVELVRIAAGVMVLDSLAMGFYGILRGLHNLKYESIGVFVGQSIIAAAGIGFMAAGIATLPLLVIALMCGSAWNVLYGGSRVVKKLGWKAIVPTYTLGWKPIKIAFAFFLAAVFMKVISYADTMILSVFAGTAAVGIYSVAYKLTNAFRFLPLAFVAALFPTLSAYAHDPNRLRKTVSQSLWYMALIGMPITFGIAAIAPDLVVAVYGSEFSPAIIPLQVLVFLLIPLFLEFPFGALLNATNRQNTKTAILGITMIVNVAANIIFINMFGVLGASIVGLASFSLMFLLSWRLSQKVVAYSMKDLISSVGGLFFSAAVMAIVVLLTAPYMHFVLSIPIGAVVYIAVAFLTRAITFNHIRSIRKVLKRKKSYVPEDFTPNI